MARPEDAPPRYPPMVRRIIGEVTAPLDAVRTLPQLVAGIRPRTGVPTRDIIVLPGYLTTDASTTILRGVLARDGHRVRGWELGRNTGDVPRLAEAVTELVRATAHRARQPVDLVGWSLGGVVARAVAKRAPGDVRRITTMGTPLHGTGFTAFAARYDASTLEEHARLADASRKAPPPVPTTVIWSRRDGVVQWRAQQDRENPWADHVEVGCTHLGMSFDGEVLKVLRDVSAADVHQGLRASG